MASVLQSTAVFDVHMALIKKLDVGAPDDCCDSYQRSRHSFCNTDFSDVEDDTEDDTEDANASHEMGDVHESMISADAVI